MSEVADERIAASEICVSIRSSLPSVVSHSAQSAA
jgi:hypothetical protein